MHVIHWLAATIRKLDKIVMRLEKDSVDIRLADLVPAQCGACGGGGAGSEVECIVTCGSWCPLPALLPGTAVAAAAAATAGGSWHALGRKTEYVIVETPTARPPTRTTAVQTGPLGAEVAVQTEASSATQEATTTVPSSTAGLEPSSATGSAAAAALSSSVAGSAPSSATGSAAAATGSTAAAAGSAAAGMEVPPWRPPATDGERWSKIEHMTGNADRIHMLAHGLQARGVPADMVVDGVIDCIVGGLQMEDLDDYLQDVALDTAPVPTSGRQSRPSRPRRRRR